MHDLYRQFQQQIKQPQFRLSDYQTLVTQAIQGLQQRHLTITAAESLTAGLFQATVASVAGASTVFAGGFVTYSLSMKAHLLQIPSAALQQHGVVSSWTAQQMANQAANLLETDYAVGLTGVAGPEKLEGQPAGTVFVGLKTPDTCIVNKFSFVGQRQQIREKSVIAAFIMLLNSL